MSGSRENSIHYRLLAALRDSEMFTPAERVAVSFCLEAAIQSWDVSFKELLKEHLLVEKHEVQQVIDVFEREHKLAIEESRKEVN